MSGDLVTYRCQAWIITRKDGVVLGFTNHDGDLVVDGITCVAATGLDASAIERSNGLSVDNSEAIGALSAAAITDEDIDLGLYDGAGVTIWQMDWHEAEQAQPVFKGTLGQITRRDGAFHAELRGPAEALNQTIGRVFQSRCDAVFGDARCGVNALSSAYHLATTVVAHEAQGVVRVAGGADFPSRWFERGELRVGENAYRIKRDERDGDARKLTLWTQPPKLWPVDYPVTLIAGCDKTYATCGAKFANQVNFRGFPRIPGEDWITSYPSSGQVMDGGKL